MAQVSADGLVTLVRGNDKQIIAVENLRREAYERAPEFQIANRNAWAWTDADVKGHVLAIWDREGNLLSTMRGIYASNRAEAEEQLECTMPLGSSWFPTIILEKAATAARTANKGLNALLRYMFIEAALQHKLGSVTGAVFEGAPRIKTLIELGYQISLVERMWDPNFHEHKPVHLVALPRKEMAMASLKLRTEFESTISRFQRDALIKLPIAHRDEVLDVES